MTSATTNHTNITLKTSEKTSKIEVIKWMITFLIGFSTGLVAFFIDTIVKLLSKLKFNTVTQSINSTTPDGSLVVSLIIMVMFNAALVLVATCLTVLEPVAAGSGIPEIKCYLNGIKIPRVARLKSLVSKAVGVLFSVAGGLFVGKEGPMIHSGAIIGAGIPQLQSITLRKLSSKFAFFRTDREKRDFVAGGAAAGVAAAFGAPIGGVLFSLEEGCSFWNQKLTWRTFFCSMSATFTVHFFLSGLEFSWGSFYSPGLINFGVFKCTDEETVNGTCRLWTAMDLFIFVLMGLIGGLLGAAFNKLNKCLTIYRMRHVFPKHKAVR
ncbi:H(+)/Cl(-) exchange transporter 6-like isoform X2 [Dreissena polymorpha]|uniref:H(+)/Cl(-) exchange transporter 6-like isoform X2 n=1 Tax=Dreissena polymorpha TaxID=45954 RepID=UPI002263D828|nr:H(+)/Cl(-) exchange transporter 6-like isoform X2 [Dreissena polymorpha]